MWRELEKHKDQRKSKNTFRERGSTLREREKYWKQRSEVWREIRNLESREKNI